MTSEPGKRLRQLVASRSGTLVPGVANALAARVAEDVGFQALYISGAGVTNTNLGLPDIGFITINDICDVVASIRRISDLPIIVDADTGFGNAVNVWHTVRTIERFGANAIQLEDQDFPKRCGHFDGKSIIPAEEMAEKVRAAREARTSDDFLIIARTDAYASLGLDEAIKRANMYVAAGADITFVEAPGGSDDIRRITQSIAVPQLVNMVIGGKTPPCSVEELREMGVGIVLYANAALQGALLGMRKALEHLRDTGMLTEADGLVARFAERQRAVRKSQFDELETRYAGRD